MGWNKSCIGLDDKGSIKVDREKAEILVARYAKSDIMEGKKTVFLFFVKRFGPGNYQNLKTFSKPSVKAAREIECP